jgi:serine/threonine protein kinase
MIGTTISHYNILEKLGEGGMGVVYKAQDTKLNRFVALKFLPDRVNRSEGDKARFMQEAQAAASLNHANICTIFGVEEIESKMFIAMEYVEGGTLRDKIAGAMHASPKGLGGQLSAPTVDDAINIAVQIGDALQEAHSKGIVHRDIKADNIMLTSKGQAKVMDFGLAKLKGAMKLTRTSSTVGTLGYMAPEQIQGAEADQRSDIFSFGVLLFEMLAGRLPFRGEHEAAMMYSILNEEPQSIEHFVPDVSPLVTNLIQRCLEKDPADRYQHFEDVTGELKRSLKKSSQGLRRPSSTSVLTSSVSPSSETREVSQTVIVGVRPKVEKRTIFIAAGLGSIVLLGLLAYILASSSKVSLNPEMTFRTLQTPLPNIRYPGLSPDGNWAAFPAADSKGRWDLYYMNTGSGEAKRLTNDTSQFIDQADISPDGSQIVYSANISPNSGTSTLIVSTLGGTPRVLSARSHLARWQPSGERVVFLRARSNATTDKQEIWSIKPDGMEERREFVDSISVINGRVSLSNSPDSKSITFLRTFAEGRYQEVVVHDLVSGVERQITFDRKNIDEVCWTPNDMIIYSSNKSGSTNLWMISSTGGDAVQITKGSGPDLGIKVSANGKKLLCYQQQTIGEMWSGSLEKGLAQRLTYDDQQKSQAVISPDGKFIAYVLTDPDPLRIKQSIQLIDRDGTNRRQLVAGKDVIAQPRWSPDGRWISYTEGIPNAGLDSVGSRKTYIVEAARPGAPKFLLNGVASYWVDATNVMVVSDQKPFICSIETGEKKRFFQDSAVGVPVLGGKYVFYRDNRVGRAGRWIVQVDGQFSPTGTPRKLMDFPGFFLHPRNNYLYLSEAPGELMRMSLPDGRRQRVAGSFPGLLFDFSTSVDGKEIVYVEAHAKGKLVMIENPFK